MSVYDSLDTLCDKLNRKVRGAFYTPKPYCKLGAELVMEAIKKVPEGNDYIILDRCAGTGNLEEALIELMGEEEATKQLKQFTLNEDDNKLLEIFNQVLLQAKDTTQAMVQDNDENWKTRGKYNSILTYGTYQIEKEINTFYQEGTSRNKKNVYHYPELNGNIKTLKTMLNEYYEKHIQPKLFEYELLK